MYVSSSTHAYMYRVVDYRRYVCLRVCVFVYMLTRIYCLDKHAYTDMCVYAYRPVICKAVHIL